MSIKVILAGLSLDKSSGYPLMILKEEFGSRSVAVPLGLFEASSVSAELEKVKFTRPLAHDLFLNLLNSFSGRLGKVEIYDLQGDTFWARLELVSPTGRQSLETRPSDAVILALKTHSPIYILPEVWALARGSLFLYDDSDSSGLEEWVVALDKNRPHRLQ